MSAIHFLKHGSFVHEFQNGRDRDGRLTEQTEKLRASRNDLFLLLFSLVEDLRLPPSPLVSPKWRCS
jgi:hypothetical protein